MLFGQVPVLFVDGEQIAHSRAAVRYLAREFKLDGGDSLTAAKIDMWIEVLIESLMKFPIHETDEKKKVTTKFYRSINCVFGVANLEYVEFVINAWSRLTLGF